MIDQNARSQLAQQRANNQTTKVLVDGMRDAILAAVSKKQPENEEVLKLVVNHKEDNKVVPILEKIGNAIALLYKRPLVLPKLFNIKGQVEITKQPQVEIKNFKDLERYFASLEQKLGVWAQAAATAPQPRIELPKFEFPKNETTVDLSEVTSAIASLEKALQGREKSPDTTILRKIQEGITEMASRPVLTPQPVTNITLNPLNGFIKTTDNTVGITLVQLPQYGQLLNRRSLIIYNNSANTIYIGGSDVTTSNGLPIPASSYGPPIDAGYDLPVYGIASQGGNDVRIIEISHDKTGNVQE